MDQIRDQNWNNFTKKDNFNILPSLIFSYTEVKFAKFIEKEQTVDSTYTMPNQLNCTKQGIVKCTKNRPIPVCINYDSLEEEEATWN
jgi:hypothetical protein